MTLENVLMSFATSEDSDQPEHYVQTHQDRHYSAMCTVFTLSIWSDNRYSKVGTWIRRRTLWRLIGSSLFAMHLDFFGRKNSKMDFFKCLDKNCKELW